MIGKIERERQIMSEKEIDRETEKQTDRQRFRVGDREREREKMEIDREKVAIFSQEKLSIVQNIFHIISVSYI